MPPMSKEPPMAPARIRPLPHHARVAGAQLAFYKTHLPQAAGADDGLRFRRLPGDQFFRDFQRHAHHVAEKSAAGKADSGKTHPGLWPVTRNIDRNWELLGPFQ